MVAGTTSQVSPTITHKIIIIESIRCTMKRVDSAVIKFNQQMSANMCSVEKKDHFHEIENCASLLVGVRVIITKTLGCEDEQKNQI